MENKNNTPVSEENLENVAGGLFLATTGCWFKPTGKVRTVGSKMEAECAKECWSLGYCYCHGKDHCVDRWHTIDPDSRLLAPLDLYIHKIRNVENDGK